jgi:hypothetical protein
MIQIKNDHGMPWGELLKLGIAGLDSPGLTGKVHRALGLTPAQVAAEITAVDSTSKSIRLGDRTADLKGSGGFYFLDYSYLVSPYFSTKAGGYRRRPGHELGWRKGFKRLFDRNHRQLPLLLDSGGYRRRISRTAAEWVNEIELYFRAIEFIDPDGYAIFDDPLSQAETLKALETMMRLFPDDIDNGRMWPVWSSRWQWDEHCRSFNRLPAWVPGGSLAALVPFNATQRQYRSDTIELYAAQAIGNAVQLSANSAFRKMVERFGRLMLGGLVSGPCHRLARHLYAATLCHIFPDVEFWLLGQASYPVINGLGMLGLLDRVVTDGTAYLQDASNERISYVADGLITIQSLEQTKTQRHRTCRAISVRET